MTVLRALRTGRLDADESGRSDQRIDSRNLTKSPPDGVGRAPGHGGLVNTLLTSFIKVNSRICRFEHK